MLIAKPTDTLTRDVIAAAIAVHREFGPGLFERAYVAPFVWELQDRGFNCVCEVPIRISYRGRTIERAYLIDLLVNDTLVVEVKAVELLLPVHIAQAITYVRLAGKPGGLLINFNVKRLTDGVRRILNDSPSRPRTSKPDQQHDEPTL